VRRRREFFSLVTVCVPDAFANSDPYAHPHTNTNTDANTHADPDSIPVARAKHDVRKRHLSSWH
jgi:hypothetical protein